MKEQLRRTAEYCAINNFDDILNILSNEINRNQLVQNQYILNLAIKHNSVDVVEILLSSGVDARTDNSE